MTKSHDKLHSSATPDTLQESNADSSNSDMFRLPVTVIVAARNEAINIGRCLDSITQAVKIYVIDSASDDDTQKIAHEKGAEVVQFKFTGGYPRKRQWAIDSLRIETPWIMLIDADESAPPALWREIGATVKTDSISACTVKKEFHFQGKKFRFGGFSHSAVLMFRKGTARFEELLTRCVDDGVDMEVHERLLVNGPIAHFRTPLCHNDFKSIEHYIRKHENYAIWEAAVRVDVIRGQGSSCTIKPKLFGNIQERRRLLKSIVMRLPFEPAIWFIYHYFIRLGILEGYRGFLASKIRAQYIAKVRQHIHAITRAS